jgi:hypothetical protein
MSFYTQVHNKDDLLDGMIDAATGDPRPSFVWGRFV